MSDSEHVFLKTGDDGKLKKTSDRENADWVRVPKKDYVSVSEWNDLITEYNELLGKYENAKSERDSVEEKRKTAGTQNDDEMITISKIDFNGYENALRILHDRALQEIDKSKADEHGYRLLRGDNRAIKGHSDHYLWLVTKATPHSLQIPPATAKFLIQQDLMHFYNMRELKYHVTDKVLVTYSLSDIANAVKQWGNIDEKNYLLKNNEDGERLLDEFRSCNGQIILKLDKIAANQSEGVYEVTYWATDLI